MKTTVRPIAVRLFPGNPPSKRPDSVSVTARTNRRSAPCATRNRRNKATASAQRVIENGRNEATALAQKVIETDGTKPPRWRRGSSKPTERSHRAAQRASRIDGTKPPRCAAGHRESTEQSHRAAQWVIANRRNEAIGASAPLGRENRRNEATR